MGDRSILAPSPRPCESCPYRRDVPSGVWAAEEYDKLIAYDRPTPEQPMQVFQCHQYAKGEDRVRLCSGWVGCHGGDLLALRLAAMRGHLSGKELAATEDYVSPVPLFDSGAEAAEHGMLDYECPDDDARAVMDKILGRRSDVRQN